MLTREADESMRPCVFKSHSLCVFARRVEDDGQSGETVLKMNKSLEVKYDGECLLEEEGVDLLQQKEFINELLFEVRQPVEVVMDQKHNENVVVVFQGGKQMNLFNEIDERILQAENEGCDEMLEKFHMEIEFLERFLKEPEGEMKFLEPNKEEIAVTMHDKDEMSLTFVELSECLDSSINNVVGGTEDNINKYDVEIREIE